MKNYRFALTGGFIDTFFLTKKYPKSQGPIYRSHATAVLRLWFSWLCVEISSKSTILEYQRLSPSLWPALPRNRAVATTQFLFMKTLAIGLITLVVIGIIVVYRFDINMVYKWPTEQQTIEMCWAHLYSLYICFSN